MKLRPPSFLLVIALLGAAGCKANEESTVLPRYPYPDGGLVDVYRRPAIDLAAREATGAVDAPGIASDVRSDGAASGDGAPACPNGCDDHNPCTTDLCDGKTGSCSNTPMAEDSPCVNACLLQGKGICKTGLCTGNPGPDGTSCEDNNLCTINDKCRAGVCYAGQEKPCPAADTCHENGTCDIRNGTCVDKNADDGKPCDDGLMCTPLSRCTAGKCSGPILWCSSGASCGEVTGGVCMVGDRVAFPSGTWSSAWEGVSFGTGTLALGPEQEVYLVATLAVSDAPDAGASVEEPARDGSVKRKETFQNDLWVARLDPASGQATWKQAFGDKLNQEGRAIAASRHGQVGVSGTTSGSLTVGKSTILSPGDGSEAFVAAVDGATGTGLWAIGSRASGEQAMALAADPITGDFVVCGTASDSAALGLDPKATVADEGDIVVARLDARKGSVVWGRQIQAASRQTCTGVAFDAAGNLFIAGTMKSGMASGAKLDFGQGVSLVGPASGTVAWVASLDMTTGQARKALRFGDEGAHVVNHLACSASGHVLVAGSSRSKLVLSEAMALTSTTAFANAFMAQLDGELRPQWLSGWSGEGTSSVNQIAVEPTGNFVIAGNYTSSLVIGEATMPLSKGVAGFVARLEGASGKVLSARGYGASDKSQNSTGLLVVGAGAAAGTIWYAGEFTGSLQLGPPAEAVTAAHKVETFGAFVGKLAP